MGSEETPFIFTVESGVAMALFGLVSALSASAGIGGGSFYVPLSIALLGFSLKAATALSQFVIMTGSIGSVLFVFSQKTLIHYDASLLITPAILFGTSLGVMLNIFLPTWILTFVLIVILVYVAVSTSLKAYKLYKSQNHSKELSPENDTSTTMNMEINSSSAKEEEERVMIPWLKVMILVAVWFSMLGFQAGRSLLPCTWEFWLLLGIQGGLALGIVSLLLTRRVIKPTIQQATVPSFQIDTLKKGWGLALFSVLAGVVGGMFGLGGGLVIVPTLLHLGCTPQVSSATSNVIVLISSSNAVIAYAIYGTINWQYAGIYGSISCVFGAIGVYWVSRIVKRTGKTFYVVAILAGLVIASIAVTIAFAGRSAVEDLIEGQNIGTNSIC